MIKSKWRRRNIYGPILIVSPLIFLFVIIGYTANTNSADIPVIRFLISIPILALLSFVYYFLFKHAPRIVIDDETITYKSPLGTTTYAIDDIKKIKYTGTRVYKIFITHADDAATITYKDGSVSYICDDYYSNAHELKQYLQKLRGEKIYQCDTQEYGADISVVKYYKGSLFLSFRFLLSLMLLGWAISVFINNIEKGSMLLYALSALLFVVFLLFSFVYYYVGVSDKYLIVKNHQLFWLHKRFLLDDIKEVVVERFDSPRGPHAPRAIRVITKDFKFRRYNAATLSDKQWRQLQSVLQAKGIHFRHQARTA